MNIYVASSWRNTRQPQVVESLRRCGHDVYDFRNPTEGDNGFHWSDIDPAWQAWDAGSFVNGLEHPITKQGYDKDMAALDAADAVVLVMPCGRSAHLELGYARGRGKRTAILLSSGEPELMYRMVDGCFTRMRDLVDAMKAEG